MKVYLVEDCDNAPGRILGVFANREDAEFLVEHLDCAADIQERTLIYGQPPNRGYNE